MKGLGDKSMAMLSQQGIRDLSDLQTQDVFDLYLKIKQQQPTASLNLLYAMIGVCENRDWRDIARERKMEILLQLDDRLGHQAGRAPRYGGEE